jgi:hypothetical protein
MATFDRNAINLKLRVVSSLNENLRVPIGLNETEVRTVTSI